MPRAQLTAAFLFATPARLSNPLVIYGQPWLGKTHLLHAIGHYARSLSPGTRVRYVSSEEFTNELIDSLRDGKGDSFRKRYRETGIPPIGGGVRRRRRRGRPGGRCGR